MNTEIDPALDPSDELLDHAIRAALVQPRPDAVRKKVLEAAVAWERTSANLDAPQHEKISAPLKLTEQPSQSDRTAQPASSHFRQHRRWGVAALVTIVAATTVMLWLTSANESWAQVVAALRQKPWSLAKYTTPEGVLHEEWISFSRDISALRHGDLLQFTDHRLNVTYVYSIKERTLNRRLFSDARGKEGVPRWFEAVFQQMSDGADKLAYAGAGVEVIEQKRAFVTRHQRNWQSYELSIRAVGTEVSGEDSTVQLNFLVDQQTRLPHYLMMSQPSMDPPSVEMELSYPEHGPIDIYDLGAPRDAKLIDLVPTNDIQRILAGIKASAERFEPHRALSVLYDAGAPWHAGTPYVVWRRGTSDRVVYGLVDSDSTLTEVPPANADHEEWWKQRWTELFHVPHEIHDGATFWTNEARPAGWEVQPSKSNPITWKKSEYPRPKWNHRPDHDPWPAGSAPLFLVYPQNLGRFRGAKEPPSLDPVPTDGPKNTVKVIVRTESPGNAIWEEHYWIDTQRSYMVVRHDTVIRKSTQTPSVDDVQVSHVVEMAEQSPSGIWYPTLVRHGFKGEEKAGGTLTRHYLDFDVKFPANIFKPVERPGEPLE